MKMQTTTRPQFEICILIFENFGFEKIQNLHLKTWNSISILNNFLVHQIDFENLKIVCSNSLRISIWDLKIWNRQHRKPQNLHLNFRFKIQIFLRLKSWFCINYLGSSATKTRRRKPKRKRTRHWTVQSRRKNESSGAATHLRSSQLQIVFLFRGCSFFYRAVLSAVWFLVV